MSKVSVALQSELIIYNMKMQYQLNDVAQW